MMYFLSRSLPCRGSRLLLASLVLAPTAFVHAQAPTQAMSQTATATSDQYSGVSNPPADDAIVANDDVAPVAHKPLPGTPVSAAPAPASQQAASAMPAATAENPDYGVVTATTDQVARARTSAAAPAYADHSTRLVTRPSDPDDGVVGMIPSPANQLAEGTDIHVRLLQALSTRETQDGQPFRAQVANDVYKDGRVVIPTGSELRGRVTQVSQGHRMGAHATIRLRPDSVILPDGTAYHLYAQAISSSEPGTRTDAEGGIQPKAHVVKDLSEYGAGAGGGAIVGAVFGGPLGAGVGALAGAGVVTTHMLLQKPQQAHVEQGSEIVFSLTEPMDLLPTRN